MAWPDRPAARIPAGARPASVKAEAKRSRVRSPSGPLESGGAERGGDDPCGPVIAGGGRRAAHERIGVFQRWLTPERGGRGLFSAPTSQSDQPWRRRRRAVTPANPRPASPIAQVEGSGTGTALTVIM